MNTSRLLGMSLGWLMCAGPGVEACSFSGAPEFKAARTRLQAPERSAPTLALARINFIPAIDGMGSCDGTGMIVVSVRSGSGHRARFKKLGLLVTAAPDAVFRDYLPEQPLKPHINDAGMASISWAWGTPPPADADGVWRWRFTVQTIDAKGILGAPLEVCAATDDSCTTGIDGVRADH